MDFLIVIFRDWFSGFFYYLYVALCIFAIFYVYGFVAKRKRNAIVNKLKEKKTYDIASGKEAAIAAMETKQVLSVEEDEPGEGAVNPEATLAQATANSGEANPNDPTKKEEVPAVMVINSSDSSSSGTNNSGSSNVQQEAPTGPQVQQPLVLDSSSVQQ